MFTANINTQDWGKWPCKWAHASCWWPDSVYLVVKLVTLALGSFVVQWRRQALQQDQHARGVTKGTWLHAIRSSYWPTGTGRKRKKWVKSQIKLKLIRKGSNKSLAYEHSNCYKFVSVHNNEDFGFTTYILPSWVIINQHDNHAHDYVFVLSVAYFFH